MQKSWASLLSLYFDKKIGIFIEMCKQTWDWNLLLDLSPDLLCADWQFFVSCHSHRSVRPGATYFENDSCVMCHIFSPFSPFLKNAFFFPTETSSVEGSVKSSWINWSTRWISRILCQVFAGFLSTSYFFLHDFQRLFICDTFFSCFLLFSISQAKNS